MKENILNIENIKYSFLSTQPIFRDFSTSVYSGEIISFLGNSGCGKSTILNLISGLLKPEDGSIRFVGKEISYLTQTTTLLNYRTAFENCLLAIELRNTASKEKVEEAKKFFFDFGLTDITLNKFPHELSGGMKQRIGLIQSILIDASLYLLDEPFTAIDRNTSLKIENQIWHKFRSNNASAIIVTHDLEQAILMSDRVVVMPSNYKSRVYEIAFDSHYGSLTPIEKRKSEKFNQYLVQLVKALSES